MIPANEHLESSSVHYYATAPAQHADILYYPISAGYYECKPSFSMQHTSLSGYLLIVMLSGALSYQTRKARGTARSGQTLLLDCSSPHSCTALSRCSYTFIHFDGAQSAAICEAIEKTCGCLTRVYYPNQLHETIGEIMNMLRDKRINLMQASTLIHSLLMQLLQASSASGDGLSGSAVVDQAIAYIQDHLSDRLTVEMIAAACGYSPSYFSRIFTQETGMSPYRFVLNSRLDRAQQLLQTTPLAIQDIAFQTGFNSAANFCYTFRKETGISPHAYRTRRN